MDYNETQMRNPETSRSPEYIEPEKLFRTRAFEINVFSTRPEGLEFESGNLLPRPDAKKLLLAQGEYGKNLLQRISSDIEKREVKSSVAAAIDGSLDTAQEKARLELIQKVFNPSAEQLEDYKTKLLQGKLTDSALLSAADVARYTREYESTHKFALSNLKISKDGSTVRADIRKVPFVFYKHIRKPEDEARGLIELANPTGVAVVIETSDGFFGLGRRGPQNGSYRASNESGGQPGAFAAGLMDMNFSRLTPPGLPQQLKNAVIIGAADNELREETGVSFRGKVFENLIKGYAIDNMKKETGVGANTDSLSTQIKITSIGRDLIAPHNEIGLTLKLPAKKQDVLTMHDAMDRNTDDKNFSEGIFFIPANKEDVTKFLTQCRTPMPPTHYMPLVSAMYEKIITQGNDKNAAKIEANNWLKELESGLDANWAKIDAMVKEYYEKNPDAINRNKSESKRDDININGFDPAVLADLQGLPSLNSELERLGFQQK